MRKYTKRNNPVKTANARFDGAKKILTLLARGSNVSSSNGAVAYLLEQKGL